MRYEGAGADMTRVVVLSAGDEIGDLGLDTLSDGEVAVAFIYDEVFFLQGSSESLRRLLLEALTQLEKLP